MVNWIYSQPTWLWGTGFVVAMTLLSCLTLVTVRRSVDMEMRRKHNDVVAAAISIVGVANAVLLAFIAVATWEDFTAADKIVDLEASLIGDLYRQTIGLPADKSAPIKADIRKYLEQVTTHEWPAQQLGQRHAQEPGRATLIHLQSLITALDLKTQGDGIIAGDLRRTLNALHDARRTRILAAEKAIPEIVWWIVGFGTALTIASTFLFGAPDFRMHLAATAIVAVSLSLVIVLIVTLDRPFRGDLSVTVDAFDHVRKSLAVMDER